MKAYTHESIELLASYQLPYFLFDPPFADLTNDARVLYALIFESMKDIEGQDNVDEEGHHFGFIDRRAMQKKLGVSERTLVRIIERLEDKELLRQERQGGGHLNRVYLHHPYQT